MSATSLERRSILFLIVLVDTSLYVVKETQQATFLFNHISSFASILFKTLKVCKNKATALTYMHLVSKH